MIISNGNISRTRNLGRFSNAAKPPRIVVRDGVVLPGMEEAFQRANPLGLGLTPPERIAVLKKAASRPPWVQVLKPVIQHATPIENIDMSAMDIPITEFQKLEDLGESVDGDAAEEVTQIPWKEAA